MNLGNCEVEFFYLDSAIVYFDKVLEQDPKNLSALLVMTASDIEWGGQRKNTMMLQKVFALKF